MLFCPPLMHCRWEKQMAHSRNSAPARLSPDRGVTLEKSPQAVFGGQSCPCGFKNVKGRLESVRPQNTFFVHPKAIC